MGIKEEITKIAVEQGYDGAKPKSIAQAIDALTDTLSGEDVKSGRSVVDAIRKYAPYVGAGGGSQRVKLFEETVTTEANPNTGLNMTPLAYAYAGKITDDPLHVVFDGTEYDLPRLEHGNYGAMSDGHPDFSTYLLFLGYDDLSNSWMLITKDAGTHTVAAFVEKGLLGFGYAITGGGITELYVSEKPIVDILSNPQFSVRVSDNTSDVHLNGLCVPSGLYVGLSFVSDSGNAPEVTGVEATVTETPTQNVWSIIFQMPANDVTVKLHEGIS